MVSKAYQKWDGHLRFFGLRVGPPLPSASLSPSPGGARRGDPAAALHRRGLPGASAEGRGGGSGPRGRPPGHPVPWLLGFLASWLFGFLWPLAFVGFCWLLLAFVGFCWLLAFVGFWLFGFLAV